jgi:hypothetical protein
MQYALLTYALPEDAARAARPIPDGLAALLERAEITGWARLHADESATTLRHADGRMLLTDGPFIDSKEYLAGLFLVEADNLDGALTLAGELKYCPLARSWASGSSRSARSARDSSPAPSPRAPNSPTAMSARPSPGSPRPTAQPTRHWSSTSPPSRTPEAPHRDRSHWHGC